MPKPGTRSPHPSFIASQVRDYRYFFLNLAPQKKGLAVACGGWERCSPDYRVQRSDFAFYGMEYVAKGRGTVNLNGREYSLMSGSLFLYEPFLPHVIQTDPGDPLVKYFVDFSGDETGRIFHRKVLGARGIVGLRHAQPIHDLYEQMIEAGLSGGRLASRLCRLLLETTALRIEQYAGHPVDSGGRARQAFERCRGILQKQFSTLHSVADLAQAMHLDPAYMARLFARFGGESPHEMLTRLKINAAASHLLAGLSTVKEVAGKAGFPDPYHFSRVFKRYYGISPAYFQRARMQKSG